MRGSENKRDLRLEIIQWERARAMRVSENEWDLRLKKTREKTWRQQLLFFSEISTSYLIEKNKLFKFY